MYKMNSHIRKSEKRSNVRVRISTISASRSTTVRRVPFLNRNTTAVIDGQLVDTSTKEFRSYVHTQLKVLNLLAKSVDKGDLAKVKKILKLLPPKNRFFISVAPVVLNEALKCSVVKGYIQISVELIKSSRVNPFAVSISPGGSAFEESCRRGYTILVEEMMQCCRNVDLPMVKRGLEKACEAGFSDVIRAIFYSLEVEGFSRSKDFVIVMKTNNCRLDSIFSQKTINVNRKSFARSRF